LREPKLPRPPAGAGARAAWVLQPRLRASGRAAHSPLEQAPAQTKNRNERGEEMKASKTSNPNYSCKTPWIQVKTQLSMRDHYIQQIQQEIREKIKNPSRIEGKTERPFQEHDLGKTQIPSRLATDLRGD